MELGRHIVIGRRRVRITVPIALLEDEGENGMRPPRGEVISDCFEGPVDEAVATC